MITRRELVIALGASVLAPLASFAQPPAKVWRIGFISLSSNPDTLSEFRLGMRELGYVEGKNFVIEWRFTEGKGASFRDLAAELVRSKVDVMVVASRAAIPAVQKATTTIPVVMLTSYDPVGSGFAASLARPGGNITGLSSITTEATPKHLEFMKTMVPKLSRVAVLVNPDNPATLDVVKNAQSVAQRSGIRLLNLSATSPQEIEQAFAAMARERAEAVIVATDALFFSQRQQIAQLALRHRLPSMVGRIEYLEAGCLMSYGQSLGEAYRRGAYYVDKIMKGVKPGELPIEEPMRFYLVINRKTAAALKITIPQELLLRADRVIG